MYPLKPATFPFNDLQWRKVSENRSLIKGAEENFGAAFQVIKRNPDNRMKWALSKTDLFLVHSSTNLTLS